MPILPARRRRCRVHATRLFVRMWHPLARLPTPPPTAFLLTLCPRPFHATPLPVLQYAVTTHSEPRRRPSSATSPPLLPMPRRPYHLCVNAGVRHLSLFFPPARLSTPYPPAKPWKKNVLRAANCL
ncbi:hypothetical protein B0H14DRAFT_3504640 [Mycena olivaceomarginata]|nr:hypothetical protein B0H14DRAFT_3504640 [Mycena olivaceomarginata]